LFPLAVSLHRLPPFGSERAVRTAFAMKCKRQPTSHLHIQDPQPIRYTEGGAVNKCSQLASFATYLAPVRRSKQPGTTPERLRVVQAGWTAPWPHPRTWYLLRVRLHYVKRSHCTACAWHFREACWYAIHAVDRKRERRVSWEPAVLDGVLLHATLQLGM
jgi:hypothetical protein